jgi:Ni/Fe-hydrogenase 1 B-type cytochrome subunit
MKSYSLQLRIWHWLHAVTVLGLLGTFFLRKTFLSWRTNAEILTAKLSEFDVMVSVEQAKALAKAVRAPMWEWHIILGFVFAVLVLWRIVMILREGFGCKAETSAHMRRVCHGYKAVYLLLFFMAVSGIVIYLHDDIGLARETAHDIKELHETAAWGVVAFVVMHIAGVFIADNRDQKGITSKMVSG